MNTNEMENGLRFKWVGSQLKTAREKSGLTQHAVARGLRYSTAQFVSNWERGVSLPPLHVLPRLSELLKISPKACIDMFHKYQQATLATQKKELSRLFTAKPSARAKR